VCKTNAFDGLQVTSTDEVGHAIVRTVDSQGRAATESSNGTRIASFGYGPFGQLESESVSNTTIGYDVLGRQVSLARYAPGIRTTVYDAYGEIVNTYKQKSDGTQVDNINYGHDPIGRLTTVTGSGMNRILYYDKSSTGAAGTNSIGKLVDAFDGQNQIHFEYNATGLLFHEDWTLSLFGAPAKSFGEMIYFYDAYGRVSNQYYPQNLPGGNYTAFNLTYAYDPYVQDVSSLSMSGTALWSITSRDAMARVTGESLYSWGGSAMRRAAMYFTPTGQVQNGYLFGINNSTEVSDTYSYLANGLPSLFALYTPTGNYTEGFGYDNLNRLLDWNGSSGGANVTYSYDWNGNLSQRSWSGETVNYTAAPTGRTATIVRNGVTVETDTYSQDLWGRIFDTPATTLTYDAADEVTSAVEKTNGNQTDTFIHDGLGERVATTYGKSAGGSYLLNLMNDAYEFKYNASTNTYEERCRFRANGKLIGDQVKTANTVRSATTFYLVDNVGSVIAEASDSGVVTARGERDPFGNAIANPATPFLAPDPQGTNPDGTSRLGFGDHERESNLGLVDMVARFYSPRLGMFVSPDSVIAHKDEARDYFPYAYVWDNPVAHVDPSGHDLAPSGGYDPGAFAGEAAEAAQGAASDAVGSAGAAEAAAEAEANAMAGGGYMGGAEATGGDDGEAIPGEDGFFGDVGYPCGGPVAFVPPSGHHGHHAGRSSTSQVMSSGKGSASTQASTDSTGATSSQGGSTPPGDSGSTDAPAGGPVCEPPMSESPTGSTRQWVVGGGVRVYASEGPVTGSASLMGVSDEDDNDAIAISFFTGVGPSISTGVKVGGAVEGMVCKSERGVSGLSGTNTGGGVDTPFGSFGETNSKTSSCDAGGPGIGTGLGVSGGGGGTIVIPLPSGTGQFFLDRLSD
jgi:RHS repeat-associated protein